MSTGTTLDEWADKYGELRSRGAGSAVAWLGIPLIVSSLIGILWSLPVAPVLSAASPAINYATMFLMATFVYYCILSIGFALGGFVFLVVATVPSVWLTLLDLPLAAIAVPVFAATFLWLLFDTWRANGRAYVTRNLQYLMLGPVWLLRAVYRKLGLAY